MSAPLRILQICHKPPRPAVDGGCIAMDSLTTGLLAEGHRVKVLTLHTQKHPFRQDQIDHAYLEATGLEAIFADTELNLRDALSHVITGESYHLSRFHVPEMDRAIEEALRVDMYDVVLLESLFTTSYIPAIRRLSDAEIVLRAHNVEHKLWEDVSQGMGPGPKKWLLNLFQSKLASEESRLLHAVDAVAAITEHDATWFRDHLPSSTDASRVIALPFGLDVENRPHSEMNTPPHAVLHLGAMDWTPNVQGVQWLKDDVWPRVHQKAPELRLLLAGRHMPADWTSDEALGIDVLGEVEDAQATYNTPCIVVVPLHAGSGMRIKLAEALAAGRPVVTTTKGMEGMDLTPGEHVWVADDAEAMGDAVLVQPQQQGRGRHRAEAADRAGGMPAAGIMRRPHQQACPAGDLKTADDRADQGAAVPALCQRQGPGSRDHCHTRMTLHRQMDIVVIQRMGHGAGDGHRLGQRQGLGPAGQRQMAATALLPCRLDQNVDQRLMPAGQRYTDPVEQALPGNGRRLLVDRRSAEPGQQAGKRSGDATGTVDRGHHLVSSTGNGMELSRHRPGSAARATGRAHR